MRCSKRYLYDALEPFDGIPGSINLHVHYHALPGRQEKSCEVIRIGESHAAI